MGRESPGLPKAELHSGDFEKIFSTRFVAQLAQVDFCGAFGDPGMARDFLPIVRGLLVAHLDLKIEVYTNGSFHNPAWWGGVAACGPRLKIIFGIDGLQETHRRHRRGTDFDRIIQNAKAFIEAGGRAQWDFLVFRHNEHEVEQARIIAAELGFEDFNIKRSSRFGRKIYQDIPDYLQAYPPDRFPVFSRSGECEYFLEPPLTKDFRNPSVDRADEIVRRHGSYEQYYDSACIACDAIRNRSVFISSAGAVFPCCWMYCAYYNAEVYRINGGYANQIRELVDAAGGLDVLDARQRPIHEIVDGPLFAELTRRWGLSRLAEGKLMLCAQRCGPSFSQYADQFVMPELCAGASCRVNAK
jgi:hypothetical protein